MKTTYLYRLIFLFKVYRVWNRFPCLRFSQLLMNLDTADGEPLLQYYTLDFDLLEGMLVYKQRYSDVDR
jgi:hypothetical protein